jgi:hypothetical protein
MKVLQIRTFRNARTRGFSDRVRNPRVGSEFAPLAGGPVTSSEVRSVRDFQACVELRRVEEFLALPHAQIARHRCQGTATPRQRAGPLQVNGAHERLPALMTRAVAASRMPGYAPNAERKEVRGEGHDQAEATPPATTCLDARHGMLKAKPSRNFRSFPRWAPGASRFGHRPSGMSPSLGAPFAPNT